MSATENSAEKNKSGGRFRLINAAYLIVYICTLNSLCTQFIAYRVACHLALGAPLFAHIYLPFAWQDWMLKFYDYVPGSYSYAFIFFALGILVEMLVYVLWVGFRSRSSCRHDDVHDTTHFATRREVQEISLPSHGGKTEQGVCYGTCDDAETDKTFCLHHDGPEYALALAPTRSGKGVSLVILTLLSQFHLVFVLDRKGENYAMTSGWRQRHASNVTLRFDLAELNTGYVWNPFGEIQYCACLRTNDAQNIAIMIVGLDSRSIESDHFRSAAFELPVGLTLHAFYKGDQVDRTPCLQDIGHTLTDVGDSVAPGTTNNLADDPDGDPKALVRLSDEIREVYISDGGLVSRETQIVITGVGTHMANTPARELGSIISTTSNALAPYRDPIVGENTSCSDFKIVDLIDHDRPVSLYFILMPKTSERLMPPTRLLLTMVMLTMADEVKFDSGRAKAAHKHRLLLMLDELPTLGRIEVSGEAPACTTGYDMKAYTITQGVSQFYKAYTREESTIPNCHIRAVYASNKLETAERMSRMTGDTTAAKRQVITLGKRFGAIPGNVSRSYQEVGRPPMEPDEIMHLPGPIRDAGSRKIVEAGEMLVLIAGHSVIRGRQIPYFADLVFSECSRLRPVPTDVVRKMPGQLVAAAPVPEGEAINQRGGFAVS